MPRLSLIIPVFNAEKTLPRSLASIRGQLTKDVEIVFVDDGSTDGSAGIISSFLQENDIKGQLIHQANGGVAVARNTGIDAAKGDYLVFLDADDKMEGNAIETILHLCQTGADIIGWDWSNETSEKRRSMRQADYKKPEDALKNLMGGTMKWNLWLYSVKRDLVLKNGIRFLPGADMGEDMLFMLMAFASASKVKQLHQALYRYNASNPDSISNVMSVRRRSEVSRNLEAAALFLSSSPYANLAKELTPHLQLYIKRPLLIGFSLDNYRLWHQWMTDANPYAMKNKDLPFRVRILQGMASKKIWLGVWIYNLVYQFLLRFK